MLRHTPLDIDKDQLTNKILELTINDDRKLFEGAIKLYDVLRTSSNRGVLSSFTDLT